MNSDLLHQICDLRSVHCTEKVVCLCQQFTYYYFPTVLSSLWDSGSQSQTTLYKTVQHFSASQMSHKFYKKKKQKTKTSSSRPSVSGRQVLIICCCSSLFVFYLAAAETNTTTEATDEITTGYNNTIKNIPSERILKIMLWFVFLIIIIMIIIPTRWLHIQIIHSTIDCI